MRLVSQTILLLALIYIGGVNASAQSNPNYYRCDTCAGVLRHWDNANDSLDINTNAPGTSPCIIHIHYQWSVCHGRRDIKILGVTIPLCADLENVTSQVNQIIWGRIWNKNDPLKDMDISSTDTMDINIYNAACWRYAYCGSFQNKLLVPCSPPCCITSLKQVHRNSCLAYESWNIETEYTGPQLADAYCDTAYTNSNNSMYSGTTSNAPCSGTLMNLPYLSNCEWTCFTPGGKKRKTILLNGVFVDED